MINVSFTKPSTTLRLLLLTALMSVSATSLMAQAPNARPGLALFDQEGNPLPPGTQAPVAQQTPGTGAPVAPGTGIPATGLVQRDFTGDPAQGGVVTGQPQGQPVAANDPFFYTETGAPGPQELADGLSEMNSNTMVQTGQQLQGNFGSLNRSSMPTGQIQEAWARPFDNMSQGQTAPGNVRFQWSHDLVMPTRLRDGMVTNIIIPDWDQATDVIIGDSSTIEARVIRGNVVALRPLSVGRDTSLTVIGGSGNVYSFYVRTEGRNTQVVTDVQVFVQASPSRGSAEWFNDQRITSGGSGTGEMTEISQRVGEGGIVRSGSASQGEELVPVDRRIFDMKMYEVNEGDRIIAPDYVYSDGKFTYFHFPAGMTDRPVIRRIVDGVEGRVNARVGGRHNEIVIVEAVGDFVMRSGTRVVCVLQVDERGAAVGR